MADFEALRRLGDQLFSRTAGAPLVRGNAVRLLRDAAENYPAWLAAIRSARRTVHFENYILHDDDVGQRFGTAFLEKARDVVPVRVVYEWFGSLGKASAGFWRRLREGGVDVRCYSYWVRQVAFSRCRRGCPPPPSRTASRCPRCARGRSHD